MADTETEESSSQEDGADPNSSTVAQDGDGATEPAGGQSGQPADQSADGKLEAAAEKHIADLRKENASWRTKLRAAEEQLAKLQQDSASDVEQARAEARQEAIAEATEEANKRVLKAETIAAAARKLRDPADALAHIKLDDFTVDEKGEVNRDAIAEAVEALVKNKPYLAAAASDPNFGSRPATTSSGSNMNDLIRSRRPSRR